MNPHPRTFAPSHPRTFAPSHPRTFAPSHPRTVAFVVPGPIDTRTGGSIYDRRMAEGLRRRGWVVDILELDSTFPFPTERALRVAGESLTSIPDDTITIVDGLALGAMPDHIERAASHLPIVALMHLPLAADPALDREAALGFEACERRALSFSSMVIVTGAATLPMLASYDLLRDRVIVVEPGTDPRPLARGSSGPPTQLLTVATLNPGKGHEILMRALAQVIDLDWRLSCVGSLTRHPPTVEQIRSMTRMLDLEDRVSMVGELDSLQLAERYDASDVFVLATLRETYGMAVAEALAHGLPVVGTATGAIPMLVGDEAGVIVPPGDVDALAGALRRVLGNSEFRAQLAAGARQVRERLPSWDHAVERFSAALARVRANA